MGFTTITVHLEVDVIINILVLQMRNATWRCQATARGYIGRAGRAGGTQAAQSQSPHLQWLWESGPDDALSYPKAVPKAPQRIPQVSRSQLKTLL